MFSRIALLFSFLTVINAVFAQISKLTQQIERYRQQFPQEKFYLQTDKPYYTLGETIWFNAWVLDARYLKPSSLSATFYADLINPEGKVVATRNLKAQQGTGHAEIDIPLHWPQGRYQIRVYSHYMANFDPSLFFQKEILIWSTALPYTPPALRQDVTLQFAPEGGELVQGIPSRIGLKAVDQSGNGIAISGRVINDLGGVITTFKTQKFGLGMVELLPKPDRKYFAEYEYQGKNMRKELPAVQPQGFTLRVFRPAPGFVQILAQSTTPNGLKGTAMVAQTRGEVFWAQSCQGGTDEQWKMSIDSIPEGVAQFTLFTDQGEPLCERLIFIENPTVRPSAQLQHKSGIPARPHEKISLNFDLHDSKGNPLNGSFAAGVTDLATVHWQDNDLAIGSWLLLQSDVKGRIEQPAYFFDRTNGDRQPLLDILLMTQGWRRFVWKEILRDTLPDLVYPAEKNGFLISGMVTEANAKAAPAAADLMLSVSGLKTMLMPYDVGKDGRFAYAVEITDTSTVLLQASKPKVETKKGKAKKELQVSGEETTYTVKVDEVNIPFAKTSFQQMVTIDAPNVQNYVSNSRQMLAADTSKLLIVDNPLATATVKTKRKDGPLPNGVPSLPYGTPQHRIIMDSLPYLANNVSVFDLIVNRVPGVRRNGNSLNVRGAASFVSDIRPLYLVDGAEVGEGQASGVNLGEIAFIDVLKNADEATVYGSRGANGVVSIYTRRDGSIGKVSAATKNPLLSSSQKGSFDFVHAGYYKARQFYQPTYDSPLQDHKLDLRSTLYWQPDLKMVDGKAQIEFYTSDLPKGFEVRVEGVSTKGYPIAIKLKIPASDK